MTLHDKVGRDHDKDEVDISGGDRVLQGSNACLLRRNKRDVSIRKLRRRIARKHDDTDIRRSLKFLSTSREERPIIPQA